MVATRQPAGQNIVLAHRSLHFPISINAPALRSAVFGVARALATDDANAADVRAERLSLRPALVDVTPDTGGRAPVAATLRAQVLAGILIDLYRNGWEVSLDEGQVFVSAPRWSTGGAGMSPEEVAAEKARARRSMSARVQAQLHEPATKRFIAAQERGRRAGGGVRSILNLIADGPGLAEAIRREGPEAVKPYLQLADGQAGRDEHTGLMLSDVFRYFRHTWSFPSSSTPGRTLSVLIRDAGQPSHPICGLLCIASPVPRLTARDAALGWTPGWLEAIVAGLDFPTDGARGHLLRLASALVEADEARAGQVIGDLSALLGIARTEDAPALAARLSALSDAERRSRREVARARLIEDLVSELELAVRRISFDGLGVSLERALAAPRDALVALGAASADARERWLTSREIDGSHGPTNHRPEVDSETSARGLRALGDEPLFKKKRAAQAASLIAAWQDAVPLARSADQVGELRRLALGQKEPWSASTGTLSGGATVSRGLRTALLQRQGRFVASQVVDVSVCGAVPPYGPLLGGKLAALLALSSDVARLYHQRYADRVSEITSQMAGRQVSRPADLVALTTTSFFGVGTSQYARLSMPGADGSATRWRFVGYSRGHGSMHFSSSTSEILQELLRVETGRGLITSSFGEGPSERMRKLRDGLSHLGLDANALLLHGMARQVFVAEVHEGATRPGGSSDDPPWRERGPSSEDVAQHWRTRWFGPRVARNPGLLIDLDAFSREGALLSKQLRPSVDGTGSMSGTGRVATELDGAEEAHG